MDSPSRLNAKAFPVWTLLLCGAAAVVFAAPALQGALIYDRLAVAEGEWWRLLTGNLVHHSPSHFMSDVLAVFVAGSLIERRRYPCFPVVCLLAAAAIGAALYVVVPDMGYYGGLSGVATGSVVYLCLHGLAQTGPWKSLCLLVLAGVGVKLVLEFTLPGFIAVNVGEQPFVSVPLAHAIGGMIAVGTFLSVRHFNPILPPDPTADRV